MNLVYVCYVVVWVLTQTLQMQGLQLTLFLVLWALFHFTIKTFKIGFFTCSILTWKQYLNVCFEKFSHHWFAYIVECFLWTKMWVFLNLELLNGSADTWLVLIVSLRLLLNQLLFQTNSLLCDDLEIHS